MSSYIPDMVKYIVESEGKEYKAQYITLEQLYDLRIIKQAIHECTRSKMWKSSVSFSKFYTDYLACEIQSQILSGTYTPDKLFHTVIWERGKERLLSSLTFKDRVVEKILNQGYILPLFRPKLIYNNCASLENRGIHFALNRLEVAMSKMYKRYGKNFYVVKCDVKSYFDNIPHTYLYSIFNRYSFDNRISKLIADILCQFMWDTAIHNGEVIPFGIGLGGEVAQSFGIICLNELDHILTENQQYKAKQYIRYMDDFILFENDLQVAQFKLDFVQNYLNQIGGMYLNTNKSKITHIDDGIKFLKVHFYLTNNGEIYRHPCQESFKREKRKLKRMYDLYVNGNNITLENIKQSYMSWRGYINTVSDIENIISIYDDIYNDQFDPERIIIERICK